MRRRPVIFAVRSGGGLEGHAVHAGDFAKQPFGFKQHFKAALGAFCGLKGMNVR